MGGCVFNSKARREFCNNVSAVGCFLFIIDAARISCHWKCYICNENETNNGARTMHTIMPLF